MGDTSKRDEITVKFFWEALPNNLSTKQLHALFKRGTEAKALANALDICRDPFEVEPQIHAIFSPKFGQGKLIFPLESETTTINNTDQNGLIKL